MNAVAVPEQQALQPVALAGPMGAAMQALQAGMTIDQMRGLLDIQKEWEANEARKAYVADMAAFKLDPPEIFKTKRVAFNDTAYMHATIGDVTGAIVEALAGHGFSHRWDTKQDGGLAIVTCTLTHRLGHSECTTLQAGADQSGKKNAIQAVASTVTYLQRYTLLAACGLATKDLPDDDGHGYRGNSESTYDAAETLRVWTDNAKAAANLPRLNEIRKQAGVAFNAGQDVQGWNSFKAVVEARRTELDSEGGKC